MDTGTEFEVIVAGGGMTGATLALGLAQGGISVAVVEAQAGPASDARASAIAYANIRQWRALGVADLLEAHAQPIRGIEVTEAPSPGAAARPPGPAFLRFDADEIDDRHDDEPLGWMVENRHIRAALSQALATAGVTVLAPATVEDLEVSPARAFLRLADGRKLGAPLVVGAEGRASRVREAAGIGTYGWDYAQAGVVATVALEEPHGDIARQVFMPSGPLAILPMRGAQASLVWSEARPRAAALVEGSEAAFEAHLARRFGAALGRPRLAGPRYAHPLGLQFAKALVGDRVALAGDAAHAIHPLAGQGLNLGLKDAAALAEVVSAAARLGEDWGSPTVLARYARWRRFDAAGLAAATDAFARVFSRGDPLSRMVRGAGMALVGRAPFARRLLVKEAGGATGDLPRLLRGQAL